MKHFSILVLMSLFLVSGTASAQNASRLNGKAYWYMMKNADGTGEEIQDNIRFTDNIMYSDRVGVTANGKPAKVSEKASGESSTFNVKVVASNGEELTYDCVVEGTVIHGTVKVKKADGTVVDKVLRGMTQEEYQRIRKMKDDYMKSQSE
jgi:hypothetical protein